MKIKEIVLKILLLCFITYSSLTIAVDSKPIVAIEPTPVVEAVPAPAVLPEEAPATKVSNGVKDAVEETKIGLIKTEKTYVDKSCHMVKGKVRCKPKKVKRKSFDSDKNLKDVDKSKTP